MPCKFTAFPRRYQRRRCCSSSMEVCESCRQTTLIDGAVLALCAPADSANRISPLSFDGDKRGRMRQFYEAVAFDQKF